MKKVILDSKARFKLERLCDALHPQECGGVLFGPQTNETIWVTDIFPIANVAENKNTTFKEHGWGEYWRDLYKYANNASWLGTFHSHPNGTIPSEQDMRAYNDSNLHLWVVHHNKGEHTFQASIGLTHANLELAAMPVSETIKPELTDTGFRLGEVLIDEHGRLSLDKLSSKLLKMKEQDRVTYLAALKTKDRWNQFTTTEIAQKLNLSRPTTSKRLKVLEKSEVIKARYRRGDWELRN